MSVSALCGSAVDPQLDGCFAPSSRMHAVTLDSLRVRTYGGYFLFACWNLSLDGLGCVVLAHVCNGVEQAAGWHAQKMQSCIPLPAL